MVGEGAAALVRRALTAARIDVHIEADLPRFLEIYDEHLLDHTTLYPGTAEMLEALRHRATLSVLTNKPQRATERILHGLRIASAFDRIIGGDTAHGRKPAPEGLQWLMRDANATGVETTLVGDSVIDLRTARAAGVRFCLVRYGFGFESLTAELSENEMTVDSPRGLAAALA